MTEIVTKSNKADREIGVEMPECLSLTTAEDLISALGEDLVCKKVNAQLTVDFRSHIRSLLESKTDDVFNNSDEAIAEMDFDDWKPTGRTRVSAEEKAANVLGGLSPDQMKAALALYEEQQAAKEAV